MINEIRHKQPECEHGVTAWLCEQCPSPRRDIPILWQHDRSKPVGVLRDGMITFKPFTVTNDMMTWCGCYRVLEQQEKDGVNYLLRVEVLEFSCGSAPKVEHE